MNAFFSEFINFDLCFQGVQKLLADLSAAWRLVAMQGVQGLGQIFGTRRIVREVSKV